jgi:hypothetical protein
LFVDHEGQDTHLGGTALVELNGTLVHLGLRIERVPAEVNGSVTEVTDEVSSSNVLHDTKLQGTDECNNLGNSSTRNGSEGAESVGDGRKGGSGVVDVSRKTDTSLGDEVSNNGKHGDTSVLEFDVTKAVELGLVTVGDKAEGIEETKRSLGTERVFESHVGGDRSTGRVLGRGKGGGTGEEGGEDNELHFDSYNRLGKIVRIVDQWER